MTIADKVGLLKQDFDEVYDAGYEKGKSEGGGGDTEAAYEQGVADGKASAEAVIMSMIDRSITEIDIPVGVTAIGGYVYATCRKVKRLTIPNGVVSIGTHTFNTLGADAGIDEVVIPDSVTTMATNAFVYSGVKKFVISKNISTIEALTFGGCNKCVEYNFTKHESVPILSNITAFNQLIVYNKAKILVPAHLYDEWIVATNWSNFADYIEPYYIISEGLEIDGTRVVGRGSCTDSVIVIPDGITAIADGAFVNDQVIDTLVLPESGTQLGTVEMSPFDGSSLRKIVNYYGGISFVLYGLSIERISFIDSPLSINGLVLMGIQGSPVYDFSKCTAIVPINGDVEFISVGENTQIIVPASLYDEWIADTNWAYFADYIVAAE